MKNEQFILQITLILDLVTLNSIRNVIYNLIKGNINQVFNTDDTVLSYWV